MEIDPQVLITLQTTLESALAQVTALKVTVGKEPIVIIDSVIPQPPSNALHTKNFSGDDLGAKINAANNQLGDREGSIVVDEPGTIATQVRLLPRRSLYFPAGRFPIVNPPDDSRIWFGGILLDHQSKIFGQGDTTKFIEPADFGWIVFQAAQDTKLHKGAINSFVTEDLELAHFSILGANTKAEGGVRSTIQLGNAHQVKINRVALEDTSCLGITAGGHAHDGNHAEDWRVWDCSFKGVASQALNDVNGRRILFENNRFLRSGKFSVQGMACIDLEPNDSDDVIQDVIVRGNLIDSTDSPFAHGNGILAQNGVGTKGFSALIENNTIKGSGKVFTGIYVAGQYRNPTNDPVTVEFARANPNNIRVNEVENVTVRKNHVESIVHSLYRFEVGQKLLAEGNEGISRGVGGSETTEVDIFDVHDSAFIKFRLKIDPPNPSAKLRIYQRGNSTNNTFEDNEPAMERKLSEPGS